MSQMGQKQTTHPRPKSTVVRCCSNSGQTRVRLECPLCAKSGLMHRSKPHLYSITASAWVRSVGGIVRPSDFTVARLVVSSNFVD
jgi:hypothetical protein